MAVEFKDYYKSLGVERTATEDEIRKAFRKLARLYHPDVAKDKTTAEEKFKEINEAYEVLSDPAKRKKYDTLGANWNRPQQPPPGWQQGGGFRPQPGAPEGQPFEFHFDGSTGFSDFFEQFFGGRAGAGGFQGAPGAGPAGGVWQERGSDVEGDILVTLLEALQGAVKSISLQQRNSKTGAVETHNFRVKIPAGVQESKLIRVAGKGEPGEGGGEAGDLYLRVRFAKHPDFRVQGAHLYHELEITPWEAVLGATINVPTIEGSQLAVKLKPGTINGQQLRIKNHGLPGADGSRGDLFAVVKIQTPTIVTDEERALWERLAEKSPFNPRKSG